MRLLLLSTFQIRPNYTSKTMCTWRLTAVSKPHSWSSSVAGSPALRYRVLAAGLADMKNNRAAFFGPLMKKQESPLCLPSPPCCCCTSAHFTLTKANLKAMNLSQPQFNCAAWHYYYKYYYIVLYPSFFFFLTNNMPYSILCRNIFYNFYSVLKPVLHEYYILQIPILLAAIYRLNQRVVDYSL